MRRGLSAALGLIVLGFGVAATTRAQEKEIRWTEISSGSGETVLGGSFDLDTGNPKQSGVDFRFEAWPEGRFLSPVQVRPGMGCPASLVGPGDLPGFDIAGADALNLTFDRIYMCGGADPPVQPGTIVVLKTNDSHFAKIAIDACGDTLKFRYVTYARSETAKKPEPGALDPPALKSPPDGVVFEHDPRDLVLAWGSVPGAASYSLQLDCKGCCAPRKEWFCADQENGKAFIAKTGLTTPAYYTLWIGPYGGRWRVCAMKADGKQGPWSPWSSFGFKK